MTSYELHNEWYDEIEKEIYRLGYKQEDFNTGIKNVIIMAVVSFDDPDNYGDYEKETGLGGYGDTFSLNGLFSYVDDCGGWSMFDWNC